MNININDKYKFFKVLEAFCRRDGFLLYGNGVVVLSGDITLLKAKTIKHLWFLFFKNIKKLKGTQEINTESSLNTFELLILLYILTTADF